MSDVILYTHNDSEIQSLKQFTSNFGVSIVRGMTADEVGLFQDENGVYNYDRMWGMYDDNEKQLYEQQYKSGNLDYLKLFTQLILPKNKLFTEVVGMTGVNQIAQFSSFNAFYVDKLAELLKQPTYSQHYKYESHKTQNDQISVHNHISVWIWCRAMDDVIDVSDYVMSCTTSVDGNGGNWQISIADIFCYQIDGQWKLRDSDKYSANFADEQFLNTHSFHTLLGQNDIIFIRFEKLQSEITDNRSQASKQSLVNNVYDMIGLLDQCQMSIQSQSADVSVNISGRDLSKVLIDDSSFFYPLQFAQKAFINKREGSSLIKRLAIDGSFSLQSASAYRSIKFTLEFLFNHISNLGYVDGSLFDGYNTQNSTTVKQFRFSELNQVIEQQDAIGIWRIINLVIDKNVSDRRVADNSITVPDGSLINQVWKVCQKPFVEFFCDTYGDRFYMTARKPPFDYNSVVGLLNNVVITENVALNEGIDQNRSAVISTVARQADLLRTINFSDISQIQYVWETECYSLYEIKPQGLFGGKGSEVSLAYIPIVYFQQYADIWGPKRLSVTSNYLTYSGLTGNTAETGQNYIIEQTVEDLIYVIQCNSYLPFTRKATVTLHGDRTIKANTWIRIGKEVGYVTSVSHSIQISLSSIERSTVIQVERLMVEKYIKPQFDGIKKIGYFDIIDIELIRSYITSYLTQDNITSQKLGVEISKNFAVNQDAFDFFIQRRQLI